MRLGGFVFAGEDKVKPQLVLVEDDVRAAPAVTGDEGSAKFAAREPFQDLGTTFVKDRLFRRRPFMCVKNAQCFIESLTLQVSKRFQDGPGDAEVAADRVEVQQGTSQRTVHIEEDRLRAAKVCGTRHVPRITTKLIKSPRLQGPRIKAILKFGRMTLDLQNILEADDPDAILSRAARLLDEGELVVLPTETVYGAAARLDRPKAVEALRRIRGSATGPFTIHVTSPSQVRDLVGPLTDLGLRMTQKLWPGPVALVFSVPPDVRSQTSARLGLSEADLYQNGEMTLRCPDHPIATEVLEAVDGVVALARVSSPDQGYEPAVAEEIALAIDAGRTRYSKPSTIVRVMGNRYEVVRDGVFDARIIERQLKTLILFVCSGNTCRSPMASALATKLIKERYGLKDNDFEKAGINVQSAGTFAMPGLRATPQAVEAMEKMGADLSHHRSRQLTPELIHAADYIFTMGRSHTQAVLAMAPSAASRVIPINPDGDVEDPIGGDLSLYQEVASTFERLIKDRFEQTLFKLHPPEERA